MGTKIKIQNKHFRIKASANSLSVVQGPNDLSNVMFVSSEALATTKMKFEKLNHLNEEIAVHKTRGRDTAHLKM